MADYKIIQSKILRILLRIGFFCILIPRLYSQSPVIAQLTGNPMDTEGWVHLGENGGGFVAGSDFVFTNDAPAQQGAIYYDQAFNLNQCKKWKIEFDLRIWGNGDPTWGHGDGVAFWYLDNPPQNFTSGGALGIPMGGRGIFVMFDTFNNLIGAPGMEPMSEIQLYYGEMNFTGNSYENDPSMEVIYIDTTPLGVNIRNAAHQKVEIEWDDGNIIVSLAGIEIYSGLLPAHDGVESLSEGYFGFSGATGAAHDQQSIREVYVRMDSVELNVSEPLQMYDCDADGDGFADTGFDLTAQESLLIDHPENFTFDYFLNLLDPGSQIQNPEDFINTVPGEQTVYVKVSNTADCFAYGEIHLNVDSMPLQQSPIIVPPICDEVGEGEITVDLTDYQTDYMPQGGETVIFRYFEDAALTDEIPPTDWTDYTLSSFPYTVWIIAEKEFETQVCSSLPGEIIFDLKQNMPLNGEEFTLPGSVFCFTSGEAYNLDLTVLEDAITDEVATFLYYETEEAALAGENDFIEDPENYEAQGSGVVYVRVENEEYCPQIVKIDFEISLNPEFAPIDPGLKKCDDDFDGFVKFNLELEALPLLNTDPVYAVVWYQSETDAQQEVNPLPTPVVEIPVNGGPVSFWARISGNICHSIAEIPLIPSEGIDGVTAQAEIPEIIVCDENFDGSYRVDLTQYEDLFLTEAEGIEFFYYATQADAESGSDPIIENLENFEIYENTVIWVVMADEEGCRELRYLNFQIGDQIQTEGNLFGLPPVCIPWDDYMDLTQLEGEISTEALISFLYYETETAAMAGGSDTIADPENYPVSAEGSVYVRIQSLDGNRCPAIVELRIEFGEEVDFLPGPYLLEGECGAPQLDLSLINPEFSADPLMGFLYFENETDAMNGVNPISDYMDYTPESESGILYIRLEKEGNCPVVLPFDYRLSRLPLNPFEELPVLCEGNSLVLDAGTEYPPENYHWEWEGGSESGPELTITAPGTYYLTILTEQGCEDTFALVIEEPAEPVITHILIGMTWLIVEAEGGIDLEYSLDGVFWQSSPRFDNLIPGETYTIYVRERGCDPVMKTVTVLLITNFISPNGDGKNDFWEVRGVEGEASVMLFDRFGKKFLDRSFQGNFQWDGKYRGDNLPSGDYWYIIRTIPNGQEETPLKYSGHISVRNQ